MAPDLDRRHEEERDQQGDQHAFGDGTEEKTSEDGADDRSGRHGEHEALAGMRTSGAAVAARRANATSMVARKQRGRGCRRS